MKFSANLSEITNNYKKLLDKIYKKIISLLKISESIKY